LLGLDDIEAGRLRLACKIKPSPEFELFSRRSKENVVSKLATRLNLNFLFGSLEDSGLRAKIH